jgi:pyruvate formate lyase activating enzyme
MVTRRDFLKVAALTPFALQARAREVLGAEGASPREALYYRPTGDGKGTVSCRLCPRACVLSPGESGFCRARKNIQGKLYSLGYALPCAVHVDPVEKKPFFHVLPKTLSLSIASAGCNLRCKFCQNWQISQVSPTETENTKLPPERVVTLARERSCASIAYTYTEPTNFFEYMLDTARLAKQKGIRNVSHSNGYISEEPLKALSKYLDAVNIDLKGFSSAFYSKLCEADLEPVLASLKTLKAAGVWVEITNLIIPGHNDDAQMITDMCQWVAKNLGPEVPIHFSRFYPMYKLTSVQPTPVTTLERARDIALKAGIRFAYVGNVPGHAGEHTYCPLCGKILIMRSGYNILENQMRGNRCRYCGGKVPGLWA